MPIRRSDDTLYTLASGLSVTGVPVAVRGDEYTMILEAIEGHRNDGVTDAKFRGRVDRPPVIRSVPTISEHLAHVVPALAALLSPV